MTWYDSDGPVWLTGSVWISDDERPTPPPEPLRLTVNGVEVHPCPYTGFFRVRMDSPPTLLPTTGDESRGKLSSCLK